MTDEISASLPTQDERTMATLAHVLQIVAWWIAPLIIYLIRRESKFVSFHALQALLWQIVFIVLWMGAIVVWIIVVVLTMLPYANKSTPAGTPPIAFFVVFPMLWVVFMGMFVLNLTLGIVYGIKAGRGEWAAYPVIGRWAHRIIG
jgi:uncharacterized Tic20 family protein